MKSKTGYEHLIYDELLSLIARSEDITDAQIEFAKNISRYADKVFNDKANGSNTEKNEKHLQAQIEALRLGLRLKSTYDIVTAIFRAAETAMQIMLTIGAAK